MLKPKNKNKIAVTKRVVILEMLTSVVTVTQCCEMNATISVEVKLCCNTSLKIQIKQ